MSKANPQSIFSAEALTIYSPEELYKPEELEAAAKNWPRDKSRRQLKVLWGLLRSMIGLPRSTC